MTILSDEQRRALALLAGVGSMGTTEALMLAHGFEIEMLADLVRDELASAAPEWIHAGGRATEVNRLRIADAGRAKRIFFFEGV